MAKRVKAKIQGHFTHFSNAESLDFRIFSFYRLGHRAEYPT